MIIAGIRRNIGQYWTNLYRNVQFCYVFIHAIKVDIIERDSFGHIDSAFFPSFYFCTMHWNMQWSGNENFFKKRATIKRIREPEMDQNLRDENE